MYYAMHKLFTCALCILANTGYFLSICRLKKVQVEEKEGMCSLAAKPSLLLYAT